MRGEGEWAVETVAADAAIAEAEEELVREGKLLDARDELTSLWGKYFGSPFAFIFGPMTTNIPEDALAKPRTRDYER